ncbi:MAG: zinc transporter 9 [Bradymonadia bacterium]|jgi:zinc transporter 9
MAGDGSKTAVAAALVGNSFLLVGKFVVYGITGSGAMLSEAIHTLADLMNQILLMIGIVRSARPANERYRYGYGQERFVWALMSAVGIFFLGCGVTIYHGIHSLQDPQPVVGLWWAMGVLIISLFVDGAVFMIAYRQLRESAGDRPFYPYLRNEADPSAVAVLLEDFAACLGVTIAMICIMLAHLTGAYWLDGVGSILIGLLLGVVALFLIARNRSLLVGQSASAEVHAKIHNLLEARRAVAEVTDIRSKILDTETYDLLVHIDFKGEALAQRLEARLRSAWNAGITDFETFKAFAADYAEAVLDTLSDEIDAVESAIREAVPEVKHIDVEVDEARRTPS